MKCVARNIMSFSVFCVFSICICIWGIGLNPAKAQFPLFGGNLGIPSFNPLYSSNYQFGQTWNTFGSNLNQSFGVIPAGYYSGSTQTKEMVKGELIVNLSDQVQIEQHTNGPRTNMTELNALLEKYGVYEIEASSSGEFYVLKFSKSHDVNEVRKAFEGVTEYVESVEPNYIRKAHSNTPSFNTMMGGMMGGSMLGGLSPQVSSFSAQSFLGQGFDYPGTGPTFGSWMPSAQPYYSSFPFSQISSSLGLTYGSSLQYQGYNFMQPLINPWQQTSWDTQQPYYSINSFSSTRRWF